MEKLAKLRKWTSCEAYELIFVWYHAENEEPWELPRYTDVGKGNICFQGSNEFLVNVHIQDIPENGADFGKNNMT